MKNKKNTSVLALKEEEKNWVSFTVTVPKTLLGKK